MIRRHLFRPGDITALHEELQEVCSRLVILAVKSIELAPPAIDPHEKWVRFCCIKYLLSLRWHSFVQRLRKFMMSTTRIICAGHPINCQA